MNAAARAAIRTNDRVEVLPAYTFDGRPYADHRGSRGTVTAIRGRDVLVTIANGDEIWIVESRLMLV